MKEVRGVSDKENSGNKGTFLEDSSIATDQLEGQPSGRLHQA